MSIEKAGKGAPGWEESASKRLVGEDQWGIGKSEVAQMFSGKQQLPVESGYNEIGFLSPSYGLPASFFFFYFIKGMLRGDKLARIQIMYFTPADQWPSDDEIERAYVLIKKDLTEQNGRPREIPLAKSAPVEFRQSEILVWMLPDLIRS